MDTWESLYPLTDLQKELYMNLQDYSRQLPLPQKFQKISSQPVDSAPGNHANSGNRVLQGTFPKETIQQERDTDIRQPIETTQQFFTWFTLLESTLTSDQESSQKEYLQSLELYASVYQDILDKNKSTLQVVDSLKKNNAFVYEKTSGLQRACEKLLDEQKHLVDLAGELEFKLSYFNSLDTIQKFLSSSGEGLCSEPEFIPTLNKLDHCISFVKSNPTYKDSDLYLMRFRQCMTRAMTLLKMHVVNGFRDVLAEIKDKDINPDEPLSSSLQIALFYVKFQNLAKSLKPLIHEMEIRCPEHQEYLALLKDCCSAYSSVRRTILWPYVNREIRSIASSHLLEYSKLGSAYMLGLCVDEHKLFRDFFGLCEDELILYLESLSMNLYDQFRPLILKETKIDDLAELCQSLLGYISSPTDEKPNQAHASTLSPIEMVQNLSDDSLSAVKFVVRKTLEDSQQRLMFRAQQFIRSEIQNFRPRMEDIELLARGRGREWFLLCAFRAKKVKKITEKILLTLIVPKPNLVTSTIGLAPVIDDLYDPNNPAMKEPEYLKEEEVAVENPSLSVDTIGSRNQLIMGKMAFGGGEYYPTLQRTLYILGRMYGSVPVSVFEDISAEAIDFCRQSLVASAEILATKNGKIDGQLFLVKNLLMLREQIIPFDVQFIRKEETLDFANMVDTLTTALRSSFTMNPISNFTTLGMSLFAASAPRIVESYADAKQLLDRDLRRICEDLILETAKSSVEPISSFLLKVSAFKLRNGNRPGVKEYLSQQNFATPEHILTIFKQFKEVLEKNLKLMAEKMSNYLGDKKTESILLKVIRANIIDNYQSFHDIITSEYDATLWNQVDTVLGIALQIDKLTGRKSSLSSIPDL